MCSGRSSAQRPWASAGGPVDGDVLVHVSLLVRDRQEWGAVGRGAQTPCVGVEFGGERGQRAADQADRAVGVVAGAAALDQAGPAGDVRTRGALGAGGGQGPEGGGDAGQPVEAGAALAGRLEGQVAQDTGGLGEAAAVGGERGEDAGAQGTRVQAEPRGLGGRDPGAVVAAHQDGGHAVEGQQPAERHAERGFHDPDFAARQMDGAQDAARLGGRPGGPEPAGAVAGDQPEVGQGLHVLDEGGGPVHPAFADRRVLVCGQGGASADVLGEGRGLAGEESSREPYDVDGDGVAAPGEGRLQVRTAPSSTARWASPAPIAAAAAWMPSRTRWGDRRRSVLSLRLAGSPSAPLATTTGARPVRRPASATAASLRCTGNAAPPRPVRPDSATVRRRAAGSPYGRGP